MSLVQPSEPKAAVQSGADARHASRPARSPARARSMRRRARTPTCGCRSGRSRSSDPKRGAGAGLRSLRTLHRDPTPGSISPRGCRPCARAGSRRAASTPSRAAPSARRTTATCRDDRVAAALPGRSHLARRPRRPEGHATTSSPAPGSWTEEMVYVAHRENLAREAAHDRGRGPHRRRRELRRRDPRVRDPGVRAERDRARPRPSSRPTSTTSSSSRWRSGRNFLVKVNANIGNSAP